MLRDFLWWWARQMRSLLPGFALPRGRFADALLVDVEGAPAPQLVHLSLRRRRRELSLGRFRLDEAGKRAAKAAIRRRPRRVVLRPDRGVVLERNVVLPLAAERDLTQVLHHEMDRLTPFTCRSGFLVGEPGASGLRGRAAGDMPHADTEDAAASGHRVARCRRPCRQRDRSSKRFRLAPTDGPAGALAASPGIPCVCLGTGGHTCSRCGGHADHHSVTGKQCRRSTHRSIAAADCRRSRRCAVVSPADPRAVP